MHHSTAAAVALLIAPALAAQSALSIDDFESGITDWAASDPEAHAGRAPMSAMDATDDCRDGAASMRVTFRSGSGWAGVQRRIAEGAVAESGADALAFWLKPLASEVSLNVHLLGQGRDSHRALATVALAGREWRRVVIPLSEFEAQGDYDFTPGDIGILQFGLIGEWPDVSFLVDGIVAEPIGPTGGPFWDLFIPCHGGWGFRQDSKIEVPNSGADQIGRGLAEFVHGQRNHPDMRSPIALRVNYPQGGRFAVVIRETSGAGGGGISISIDGDEILSEEHLADSERVVSDYAGEYSVAVPPGDHVIGIDNPGPDWTRVRGYRLTNYVPWYAYADGPSGTVSLRLNDMAGGAVVDADVKADVVGMRVPMEMAQPGVYTTTPLAGTLERGVYPVRIHAVADEEMRTEVKLEIARSRLELTRAAYALGEPIDLAVRYLDEARRPIDGAPIRATIAGREHRLNGGSQAGSYVGRAPRLSPGKHVVELRVDGEDTAGEGFIYVHPPFGQQMATERVRLADGRFELNGRPWLPVGFATVHTFTPTLDRPDFAGGWVESSWSNAPDHVIADWLATLAAQGINVVRMGLTVPGDGIPGDLGGEVDARVLNRFARYVEIADTMGLRVLPVLYWGHYGTFGFDDVPAYEPLITRWVDWFTNVDALAIQRRYVREVVSRFAGDPRIFAWEPMNEIQPSPDDDPGIGVGWTNAICETIREVDPDCLVTVSANTPEPWPISTTRATVAWTSSTTTGTRTRCASLATMAIGWRRPAR